LSSALIQTAIALVGFLAGVGVALLIAGVRRRKNRLVWRPHSRLPHTDAAIETQAKLPKLPKLPEGIESLLAREGSQAVATDPPHLSSLLARALREPIRQLRRVSGCPPAVLRQLELIAWQTRMLSSALRPMQAKLVSPISLLQEAALDVSLLGDGSVAASWSLLCRELVQVDPDRTRSAFREILSSNAEICGKGGRLAVRILPGTRSKHPVQIEVEIGRPGSEADPLALIVARRLLESQGGRVELDGRITRVHLRGSAPRDSDAVEEVGERHAERGSNLAHGGNR